ncbi:MAG TPA: DUF5666 domain-containing protein [Thermoanaerobaculia bacterium]|nr:DUF5666 domain-containing protein [Thermoanaerobaculia bacterium]
MKDNSRISNATRLLALLVCGLTVSAFAEERTPWRTAAEIQEGIRGSIVGKVTEVDAGTNQVKLQADDDPGGVVIVATDAVTTEYAGFGGVINGKPEIFTGTPGFSNIRAGDRLEVRGTGRGTGTVIAEEVILLGRTVAADQTGVGSTRPPSSVTYSPAPLPEAGNGRIDGIVRQVNGRDSRLLLETSQRTMITVRGSSATPVRYRGDVYRIANLEVGDRVRIEPESSEGPSGEVRARSIEVLRSVQESGGGGAGPGSVASIAGRVTSVDRRNDTFHIDTGRGDSVLVDVHAAFDGTGHRVRGADMIVGDRVEISGHYGSARDVFVATTVRWPDERQPAPQTPIPPRSEEPVRRLDAAGEYVQVTIYGTIKESLRTSPQIVVADDSGRATRVYVSEDFVVRSPTGSYVTADALKEGDSVVVKAFRDTEGNAIAQSIRMR